MEDSVPFEVSEYLEERPPPIDGVDLPPLTCAMGAAPRKDAHLREIAKKCPPVSRFQPKTARTARDTCPVGTLRTIEGRVDDVRMAKNGERRFLVIGEETFSCVASKSLYLPVKAREGLVAEAEKEEGAWRILDTGSSMFSDLPPPWVIFSTNREDLIWFIQSLSKGDQRSAEVMYNRFGLGVSSEEAERRISLESMRVHDLVARKATAALREFVKGYKTDPLDFFRKWYLDMVMRRFYTLGLNKKDVRACVRYGEKLMELRDTLEVNPYKILALPIEKADAVMRTQRREIDPVHRRLGQIAREIARVMDTRGDSAMPATTAYALFGDEILHVKDHIGEYGITYDPPTKSFYTQLSLDCEMQVAASVARLIGEKGALPPTAFSAETLTARGLDPSQVEAMLGIASHGFSILTGRAGTGKTTVMRALVDALEGHHLSYILCSFTGKAVSRIEQAVRRAAFTIHRLLSIDPTQIPTLYAPSPDPVKGNFSRTKENGNTEVQALIIDEVSMVPTHLFWQLLRKFPHVRTVVFVGDVEQLPPIEWGSLLREVVHVPGVPVYRLTRNHRIHSGDAVVAENALVLQSNIDALNNAGQDFRFLPGGTALEVYDGGQEMLADVLANFREQGVALEKIAVVTPYNALVEKGNQLVRDLWFSEEERVPDECDDGEPGEPDGPGEPGAEESTLDRWWVGARVMQTVNDYTFNVMNGTEGVIVGRSRDGDQDMLQVEYEVYLETPSSAEDGAQAKVERRADGRMFRRLKYVVGQNPETADAAGHTLEWGAAAAEDVLGKKVENEKAPRKVLYTSDLTVSFASTIHKQQGSEFPHIVVYCPQHGANASFLTRELVNVAITRARDSVTVVGDIRALERAAARPVEPRFAFLGARLARALKPGQNK